jgi:hypothetical protein
MGAPPGGRHINSKDTQNAGSVMQESGRLVAIDSLTVIGIADRPDGGDRPGV